MSSHQKLMLVVCATLLACVVYRGYVAYSARIDQQREALALEVETLRSQVAVYHRNSLRSAQIAAAILAKPYYLAAQETIGPNEWQRPDSLEHHAEIIQLVVYDRHEPLSLTRQEFEQQMARTPAYIILQLQWAHSGVEAVLQHLTFRAVHTPAELEEVRANFATCHVHMERALAEARGYRDNKSL